MNIRIIMFLLCLGAIPLACLPAVQAPAHAPQAQASQNQAPATTPQQVITINGSSQQQQQARSGGAQELSFQTWLALSTGYSAYFEPERLFENPLLFSREALLLAGCIYLSCCAYNHWDYYQKVASDAVQFTQNRLEDTYNVSCATGRFCLRTLLLGRQLLSTSCGFLQSSGQTLTGLIQRMRAPAQPAPSDEAGS